MTEDLVTLVDPAIARKYSFPSRNSTKIGIMRLANGNLAHDQKTHRNDALW